MLGIYARTFMTATRIGRGTHIPPAPHPGEPVRERWRPLGLSWRDGRDCPDKRHR